VFPWIWSSCCGFGVEAVGHPWGHLKTHGIHGTPGDPWGHLEIHGGTSRSIGALQAPWERGCPPVPTATFGVPGGPALSPRPTLRVPVPTQEEGYARVLRGQLQDALRASRMVAVCQYNSMADEDVATLRHFLRRHGIHVKFGLGGYPGGIPGVFQGLRGYPGGSGGIPGVLGCPGGSGVSWGVILRVLGVSHGYPHGSRVSQWFGGISVGVSRWLWGVPVLWGVLVAPGCPGGSGVSRWFWGVLVAPGCPGGSGVSRWGVSRWLQGVTVLRASSRGVVVAPGSPDGSGLGSGVSQWLRGVPVGVVPVGSVPVALGCPGGSRVSRWFWGVPVGVWFWGVPVAPGCPGGSGVSWWLRGVPVGVVPVALGCPGGSSVSQWLPASSRAVSQVARPVLAQSKLRALLPLFMCRNILLVSPEPRAREMLRVLKGVPQVILLGESPKPPGWAQPGWEWGTGMGVGHGDGNGGMEMGMGHGDGNGARGWEWGMEMGMGAWRWEWGMEMGMGHGDGNGAMEMGMGHGDGNGARGWEWGQGDGDRTWRWEWSMEWGWGHGMGMGAESWEWGPRASEAHPGLGLRARGWEWGPRAREVHPGLGMRSPDGAASMQTRGGQPAGARNPSPKALEFHAHPRRGGEPAGGRNPSPKGSGTPCPSKEGWAACRRQQSLPKGLWNSMPIPSSRFAGACIDDRILSRQGVENFARLPSLEVCQGQTVAALSLLGVLPTSRRCWMSTSGGCGTREQPRSLRRARALRVTDDGNWEPVPCPAVGNGEPPPMRGSRI
ncbi:hypothetical protein DV515_00019369, partial [Chloebia gouldiae]